MSYDDRMQAFEEAMIAGDRPRMLAELEQALQDVAGADDDRFQRTLDLIVGCSELDAVPGKIEAAIALRERNCGPRDPVVEALLQRLAELLGFRGEHAQAIPFVRRLIELRERRDGPTSLPVARALLALGDAQSLGGLEDAHSTYVRAVSILEMVAPSTNTLAVAKREAARTLPYGDPARLAAFEEAVASFEGLSEAERKTSDHANALYYLQNTLRDAGDLARAETIGRRTLALFASDETIDVSHLSNLAETLKAAGRPDEAVPLVERMLAQQEKVFGADNPMVASTRAELEQLRTGSTSRS